MSTTPTPSVSDTEPNPRTPIGEVHLLVYSMSPGQTEIQVKVPAEAQGTAASQVAKRNEFASLVMSELQKSADLLRG